MAYRVKAQQLHDLREFYRRYRKNDRLDAKAGAKMPDDVLTELYLPPRDYMALDRATHQHEKLTRHLQREKTRLQSLLEAIWRCAQNACALYRHGHDVVDFEQFAREIKRYYQHLVFLETLLTEVEAEIRALRVLKEDRPYILRATCKGSRSRRKRHENLSKSI